MKFLIDECVWKGAGRSLELLGHDVAYVVLDSSGVGDDEVLERAETEDRIVITLDKRMSRLVVDGQWCPRGIVVLEQADTRRAGDLIMPLLNQLPGQIAVIGPDGDVRLRPISPPS